MKSRTHTRVAARGAAHEVWVGDVGRFSGPIVLGHRDAAGWDRARSTALRLLGRFAAAADPTRQPFLRLGADGDALVLPGRFRTAWFPRNGGGVLLRVVASAGPSGAVAVDPSLVPEAAWVESPFRFEVRAPLHLLDVAVKDPRRPPAGRSIEVDLAPGRYELHVVPSWEQHGVTYQGFRLRLASDPVPVVVGPGLLARAAPVEVTAPIRRAAARLRFVATDGGPLLLVPRKLAASWHGTYDATGAPSYETAPCDYDRAIAGARRAPFLLDVGTGRALVLPGSTPTAWHPTSDGGLLIRWAGADGAAALLAGALALPSRAWSKTRLRLSTAGSGELWLLDAAADGSKAASRRGRLARIPLQTGTWAVDVAAATGLSRDRGTVTSWSAEVVRLRRA